MANGIKIVNNFGTTLIDDTSPVLALRSVQNVTTVFTSSGGGSSNFWGGYLVAVTFNNVTFPVIALRCTTRMAYIRRVVKTGTSVTVYVGTTGGAAEVTVYLFDLPVLPAGNLDGLVVKNASSQLMYWSGHKAAVIAATGMADGIWTGEVGRQYALAFHTGWWRHVVQGSGGDNYSYSYQATAARCYDHRVDYGHRYQYASGLINGGYEGDLDVESGIPGGIIIDVTTY